MEEIWGKDNRVFNKLKEHLLSLVRDGKLKQFTESTGGQDAFSPMILGKCTFFQRTAEHGARFWKVEDPIHFFRIELTNCVVKDHLFDNWHDYFVDE